MADTWREQLLPASFRGETFLIEDTSVPVGRKVQLHEYPKRDEAYAEQMGKVARVHKVKAYIIGADCFQRRDKLLKALETEGEGTLVHPWLGQLSVVPGACEMAHSRREGGMVTFDLTFYPGNVQTNPSVLYGYLDWIAKQILPDTADAATLERQALLRLETPRIAAKSATGTASFQASAGSILDANLVVQASDGRQYRVVTAVNPVPGMNTAKIEAVDGGALGNAPVGLALKLVQPVAGIDETFTVLAPGITGGSNQESIESLRSRVIRSYRVIPHGGNAEDYVTWALECAGVTRAWTVRNYMGPGTVGVFFVRDGDASIIPDANEVATVKAYISTKAPVTAEVFVLAPVLKAVNYMLKITPDTSAVRAAVVAELADLHEREAGLGETLLISHIREAISSAEGEMDNLVSTPAADVTAKANELLTVGDFTWL